MTYYYKHHNHFMPHWTLSRTTWVSWYQKGKARKVKPIWIYWSKREWVAVAPTGPDANLHLAPDTTKTAPHHTVAKMTYNTWIHTFCFRAFRRKNALHDSQDTASKLHPRARSPQTLQNLSPFDADEFPLLWCFIFAALAAGALSDIAVVTLEAISIYM